MGSLTGSSFRDRHVGSVRLEREDAIRISAAVYRLTLVAGWNAEDAMGYAKLIDLGKPDFIEIKGMTYCGNTSGASNLTMKNVPYHDDVKAFGEALCAARIEHAGGVDGEGAELTGGTPAGAEYGLACEHRHSCCILLARKDPYLVDGKWHTWIDYEVSGFGGFREAVSEQRLHAPDAALVRVGRGGGWVRSRGDARA